MTMSIPSMGSSGNMSPASTTTRWPQVSRVIMLRPISPTPPRKVRSTQLCVAAAGAIGEVGVIVGGDGLEDRGHQVFLAPIILGMDGRRNYHPHRPGPHPDAVRGLNKTGAAEAHRHDGLPGFGGHDEDPFLKGTELRGGYPG